MQDLTLEQIRDLLDEKLEPLDKKLNEQQETLDAISVELRSTLRGTGHQDEFYYWLETQPEHISQLNEWLQEFINKYNTWRPHQLLNYLTPLELVKKLQMS